MSSEKVFSEATEGLVKGLLDWSTEKISGFVEKLKARKLAFIEESTTIAVVKELYNSGEAKFYAKYVKDKELLLLVRMGLTLRKLENDGERLMNLRNKIYNRYGPKGLHTAQFVQNGISNRYFGLLIEKIISEEDLGKKMYDVLINIEKHALFVSSTNKISDVVRKVTTITDAHLPAMFFIAGLKSAAEIVQESIPSITPIMEDYEFEKFSSPGKEIIIFTRR